MAISNKFHHKLWRLVSDSNECAKWHESGESILIDFDKLKEVLHKTDFCKSRNLASFVRQLNLYGFKIVLTIDEKSRNLKEYYNRYFKRDKPHLLNKITRNGTDGSFRKIRRRRLTKKKLASTYDSESSSNASENEKNCDEEIKENYSRVKVKEEITDDGYGSPTKIQPSVRHSTRKRKKFGVDVTNRCSKIMKDLPLAMCTRNKSEKLADILSPQITARQQEQKETFLGMKMKEEIPDDGYGSASCNIASIMNTSQVILNDKEDNHSIQISPSANNFPARFGGLYITQEQANDLSNVKQQQNLNYKICTKPNILKLMPEVTFTPEPHIPKQMKIKNLNYPVEVIPEILAAASAQISEKLNEKNLGYDGQRYPKSVSSSGSLRYLEETSACKTKEEETPIFKSQISTKFKPRHTYDNKAPDANISLSAETLKYIEIRKESDKIVDTEKFLKLFPTLHENFRLLKDDDHPVFNYCYNNKLMMGIAFYGEKLDYEFSNESFMDTYGRSVYLG